MPATATHIIHRQRYHLKVATQQDGRRMQQQLQEFNLQHLLPALNTHFNNWFQNEDEVVTINKLEIDLGFIHSSASTTEWLQKIIHQIEQKLSPVQPGDPLLAENEWATIEKRSATIHASDALVFFLQNGLLPQGIYQNIEAVFDALQQISGSEKEALIARLQQDKNEFIPQRIAMLKPEQAYFFVQLFLPVVSVNNWNDWLRFLVARINEVNSVNNFPQGKTISKTEILHFLFRQLLQSIKEGQTISWNELKDVTEKYLAAIAHTHLSPSDAIAITDNRTKEESTVEKQKPSVKKDEELITPEGIFITNAGICLASAYLPLFFKALQFTDGAIFLSTHLQERAIHVLYFLASGKEDASEEKLVVSKLLCGWSIQMPLTKEIILTQAERTEATELLQSMIEHWQALKSTSPDGLREGFLQRNGKVSDKENNYLLQVEHQSIDILLEYIPWQFRFIKLPWMKKSIEVEWY